ncbi:MAG: LacI family DNA-binding transcriptional regulator [Kiritimatiellae bacterium]|nr:LacI family DNA-binding transcriptional regulator [Kiritimatiellia bacterium]
MPRTTIKDIAKECGVSLSTVSLVLNNNPRISAKTRETVLASVEKHGYQPNASARNLASRTSRTICVAVPALSHVFADVYFGEIVSGIYDRASEAGYKVILDLANPKFVESKEYLKVLKSRRADGMLFISSSVHDTYLADFEGGALPFLLVNHFFPGRDLNFIAADYEDTARQAADHLINLGHTRLGLISGTNTHTGLTFRDAFLRHCKSRGLKEENAVWLDSMRGKEWSQEGGFDAANELLTQHPHTTAIMCGNDRLAIGVMRHLRTRRLRIPEDLSVAGVDDIPESTYTNPGLTTVRHNLYQMGKVACERLLALFRGELAECREILPVQLIARESTGPARPA